MMSYNFNYGGRGHHNEKMTSEQRNNGGEGEAMQSWGKQHGRQRGQYKQRAHTGMGPGQRGLSGRRKKVRGVGAAEKVGVAMFGKL